MNYAVNSILNWKTNDKTIKERMLWMDSEWTYVIDIEKNQVPFVRKVADIKEAISAGEVVIGEDDAFLLRLHEEDIPEKHKEIRDKSWGIIKDIVAKEPEIYQSGFRRQQIRDIAESNGLSELSVINYMKRYWKNGKTPNSLLPFYYNCGGKGKKRKTGTVKLGRPRMFTDIQGEGVNVTDDVKRIFQIAINKYYYTTAKNSLTLTYELMLKDYFVDGYTEKNGVNIPNLKKQSQIPSFGQFRYYFEKERNLKREYISRYSNKKFQKQYRAITGNASDGVYQPGTYEIDCQVGDVYLVSSYNRKWIIGRPAIYVVIDKFTRLICGMYIGLESGSYIGAMMAIYNSISDKVEYCRKYGIGIEEKDWPVRGLPEAITIDNGELLGKNIESLINMLNIKIQNVPPYRADLKSAVERFFGLNNDRVKPFTPGKIDLEGRERGDKDYRLSSLMTLAEFTKLVIKCVLYHNNHYNLDYYKRDEDMIDADVPCIPIALWNWAIEHRGGSLRMVSDEAVKLALMPTDSAVVTAKGIRYRDMYYASSDMLKSQIFINARTYGVSKVKISYDPRDMGCIYVHVDKAGQYETCMMIDSNSRYKGKMIEEIEFLLAAEKLQKEKMRDSTASAKARLITEVQDIVKRSEEEYKKSEGSEDSGRKRLMNIDENRRVEKLLNRKQEAFVLGKDKGKEVDHVTYEDKFEDDSSDTMSILLALQKEGLNDE